MTVTVRNVSFLYPGNRKSCIHNRAKIITSFSFFSSNPLGKLWSDLLSHSMVLCYYMVPAFLYSLYNNLSFTNLAYFDPTTYFMFMQIRLLMTGVIYQVRSVFENKNRRVSTVTYNAKISRSTNSLFCH